MRFRSLLNPLVALFLLLTATSLAFAAAPPEVDTGALRAIVRRNELINGQWKYYVRVGINRLELEAHNYTLNHPEAAASWFLERDRGGQMQGKRFHPDHVEVIRLRDGTPLTVLLVFNTHIQEFKKQDTVTPYVMGVQRPAAQDEDALFYPEHPATYN